MTKKIIWRAFINSAATLIYIVAVAFFMLNAEKIISQINGVFGPVFFLLLFVLSAGVTGGLVLGGPIMKYLDGDKKGAIYLFCLTLAWLFLFTVIGFLINFFI